MASLGLRLKLPQPFVDAKATEIEDVRRQVVNLSHPYLARRHFIVNTMESEDSELILACPFKQAEIDGDPLKGTCCVKYGLWPLQSDYELINLGSVPIKMCERDNRLRALVAWIWSKATVAKTPLDLGMCGK